MLEDSKELYSFEFNYDADNRTVVVQPSYKGKKITFEITTQSNVVEITNIEDKLNPFSTYSDWLPFRLN